VISQFSALDWLLVLACLSGYAWIGLRARARSTSIDEFLVMGRRLGPYWGVATLAAAETGLVTFVYFAEESYLSGFAALMLPLIGALMMWLVGWKGLVVKKLRMLEARTVPEFLETHFSTNVRSIAGLATFIVGVLNMGIFLQVESTFLAIVMAIPESQTLVFMAVLLVVVVVYTMLGGMYCVVLTDVVQFVMIVFSAVLTTWMVIRAAGGWGTMVQTVQSHYGKAGFEFWKSSRYSTLFLTWTALYYLSGWSTWQPVVARVLSMKDIHTALKLFRISSMFMFLRGAVPMIWGIGVLVILGTTANSTMSLAHALARILPAGIVGLACVGFVSATMSTFSSYLLAFSSILLQDVISPRLKRDFTPAQRVLGVRYGVVFIGVFIYLWGAFYHFPDTVFRYITLTGSLSYAATMTVLVGGMYWKRGNTTGAYCAFAGSAIPPIVCLAVPTISATNAGLLSFTLAPIAFVTGSLLNRKRLAASL
jgi:SSS family solute:Na+ symporter